MTTVFLVLGVVGVLLLALFTFVDDHLGGIFDALGGGDWFSGASLSGFLGALGFGGLLVLSWTGSVTLAWVAGAGLGLGLGALVAWAMFRLRHTQDGGAPTTASLLGQEGTVVTAIPADGFGEVKLLHGGHLVKLSARANLPITPGQPVTVIDVLSPTAVRVAQLYQ
ncbi:MAG: NfeD family protein [Propionibacteriaceae bacterium]|jgi:membrane protein implicated in regulation of membrane protease activity|nr:NfeD family protein [Propionibacteriaceae bacterium]